MFIYLFKIIKYIYSSTDEYQHPPVPGATWHYKNAVLSKKPANTSANIADNFIKIFNEGPVVSFNGDPTVYPTAEALCSFEPTVLTFPSTVNYPLSIYFLTLLQIPPAFTLDRAITKLPVRTPIMIPVIEIGPKSTPTKNGIPIAKLAGQNISLSACFVVVLIDLS